MAYLKYSVEEYVANLLRPFSILFTYNVLLDCCCDFEDVLMKSHDVAGGTKRTRNTELSDPAALLGYRS